MKLKFLVLKIPWFKSYKAITAQESQVLSTGLNFSVTPKEVNILDFITGIESSAPQLSEEVADQFRSEAV